MMHRVLTLSLAVLLTVSCTDQTPLTSIDQQPTAPLLGIGDAPAASGPNLIRGQQEFAVFWADNKTGLSAVVGADIVDFCNNIIDFDVIPFQRITSPQDQGRFIELTQGTDLVASVWPFTNFDCSLFTTVDPVGVGYADVINTDNDLNPFAPDGSSDANAFGFRAHGALSGSSGDGVQFSGHSNCRWRNTDFATMNCSDVVNAH